MIPIKLLRWQEKVEKAVRNGARFIYIKAGRKTGKTKYLEHRIVQNSLLPPVIPEQINAYIAPSRVQAKNILWRRLKISMPKHIVLGRMREVELVIDIHSGIRNQLFGAEHEDALRGLNFGPSILDEADFMRDGFYEEIVEPNLAVTKSSLIMSSTPKNSWFCKKWTLAKSGKLGRKHKAFKFTIFDNPYISKKDISKIRASIPADLFEREYLANEYAYSGLQYAEFNLSHIVHHKEPGPEGVFARAIDWGWTNTHILWGEVWYNPQTGKWNLYVYRELALKGKNVEEISQAILVFDKAKNFLFNVIDISALRKEISTGTSIISEFAKREVPCRLPIGRDDVRINATKMMFKRNEITVSENCPILIKQLREVEWEQKGDGKDDATDALKYLCSCVYDRDFSGEKMMPKSEFVGPYSGIIDPTGILAGMETEDQGLAWEIAV